VAAIACGSHGGKLSANSTMAATCRKVAACNRRSAAATGEAAAISGSAKEGQSSDGAMRRRAGCGLLAVRAGGGEEEEEEKEKKKKEKEKEKKNMKKIEKI